MDLCGYGVFDKFLCGYDIFIFVVDVVVVVCSFGSDDVVIVGYDWGGWIVWLMLVLELGVICVIVALSILYLLVMKCLLRCLVC